MYEARQPHWGPPLCCTSIHISRLWDLGWYPFDSQGAHAEILSHAPRSYGERLEDVVFISYLYCGCHPQPEVCRTSCISLLSTHHHPLAYPYLYTHADHHPHPHHHPDPHHHSDTFGVRYTHHHPHSSRPIGHRRALSKYHHTQSGRGI